MKYVQQNLTLTVDPVTGTSDVIDLTGAESLNIIANVNAMNEVTSHTFSSSDINLTTSTITIPNHGWFTGVVVSFVGNSGVLPSPLGGFGTDIDVGATNFAVIRLDENTIQLAINGSGAMWNGNTTPVVFTDIGQTDGNDTTWLLYANTPAIFGKLLISNNGTDFATYQSPTFYQDDGIINLYGVMKKSVADIVNPTALYAKVEISAAYEDFYDITLDVLTKTDIDPA